MSFSDSSRSWCGLCQGDRVLSGSFVFGRLAACTCGVTPDVISAFTLHDADCDTVPCPFCQLLDAPVFQEV